MEIDFGYKQLVTSVLCAAGAGILVMLEKSCSWMQRFSLVVMGTSLCKEPQLLWVLERSRRPEQGCTIFLAVRIHICIRPSI